MPDPDVEQEIEDLESELERKQSRLEELRAQRSEQEEVDLDRFEEMDGRERKELKDRDPDRWRELMSGLRERNEAQLDTSGQRVI